MSLAWPLEVIHTHVASANTASARGGSATAPPSGTAPPPTGEEMLPLRIVSNADAPSILNSTSASFVIVASGIVRRSTMFASLLRGRRLICPAIRAQGGAGRHGLLADVLPAQELWPGRARR